MNLQLNKEQVVLVEAALILFSESLIGSEGALESLKREGNPDVITLEQIDNELKEARFAREQIDKVLIQFENLDGEEPFDITKKPDWL